MKGIAHFLTGVALATCFADVVARAGKGSLLPVLGGIGGLLPDVLDFRFVRYFERYDVEIDPAVCPPCPLPTAKDEGESGLSGAAAAAFVADGLVAAMHAAYTTGEPCSAIVHTLRLGQDLWRRYTIRLDPEGGALAVCFGPRVTTGGVTFPGTELPDSAWVERRLAFPLAHTYSREYVIDGFTGPSFRFVREPAKLDVNSQEGDVLAIHFLDWHHRWTHSLPLAVAVGLIAGLLLGLMFGRDVGGWAGWLTGLGFAGHVLEDQLGHMGSNLFWPFTRRRLPGLKLLHASDAIPNFLTCWTSLALVLLNLDRFGGTGMLLIWPYVVWGLVLPWLVLGGHYATRGWRGRSGVRPQGEVAAAEAERLAEVQGFGDA